ncbi:hypothetical protein [Flexithrix dorotheae]|uniref:hypothetical protein n=1 Tax=Flexithrix dorotheae TaxID=70993 RepID=UPI00037EE2E1|nr:hypothetical protein [Flexithrix dorotheae]
MKLTKNDFKDIPQLSALIKAVDNIDAEYANRVSDEIYKYQPFFLSVLLGYRLDTKPEELDELMRVYFMIWEYFKSKPYVKTKKITEAFFERAEKKHIDMLKYSEGEPNESARKKVFSNDLENLQSKGLWTAVLLKFEDREALLKMEKESKVIILIGIKSFIECFENL